MPSTFGIFKSHTIRSYGLGGDAAERFFAVAGAIDDEPGVGQRLADGGRQRGLILDDQHSRPCQRVEVGPLRRQ